MGVGVLEEACVLFKGGFCGVSRVLGRGKQHLGKGKIGGRLRRLHDKGTDNTG